MRRMTVSGMVIIAASVVATVTAATAVAAPEFLSSVAGGALTGKATETQVFTTNFGSMECAALTASGTTPTPRSSELHVTQTYGKCKAFGLTAIVTKALYLFLANGNIHVTKSYTITTTGCILTIKAQTIRTVKYSNSGTEIVLTPELSGIAYEGTGTACSGSAKNGTLVGKSQIGVIGGTISWMS